MERREERESFETNVIKSFQNKLVWYVNFFLNNWSTMCAINTFTIEGLAGFDDN
jgi:hypothetical protein